MADEREDEEQEDQPHVHDFILDDEKPWSKNINFVLRDNNGNNALALAVIHNALRSATILARACTADANTQVECRAFLRAKNSIGTHALMLEQEYLYVA